MNKRLTLILSLTLVVALIGVALVYAGGAGHRNGGPRPGRGPDPFANLNEEQQTEIRSLVEEMREVGDPPEEIRAAVREKLDAWGIEMPERPERSKRSPRQGRDGSRRPELTEEQRAALSAIREKVKEMREAGASPEEIRDEVGKMAEEAGVELPKRGRRLGGGDLRRPELTDDQRATVRAKVEEMKAAGAPREEIREAVRELIASFGDTEDPSAKVVGASSVQPSSWGEIKKQMN